MRAEPGARPWYREPMVWLVIGIPASSVIMGAVMISLAVASYDGLVADDYYKRGLEIDRVLDRDRAARAAGLVADLRVDAGGTRVTLDARAPGFAMPGAVELRLSHATTAGRDRALKLTGLAPGEYAGPALTLAPGRYYVEIAAADWRLTGALDPGRTAPLRLVPIAGR